MSRRELARIAAELDDRMLVGGRRYQAQSDRWEVAA